VNPVGAAVYARFDYGTATSYGKHTPYRRIAVANRSTSLAAKVSGLRGGQTLHYRVEVRTDFGSYYGHDRTYRPLRAAHLTIGHSHTVNNGARVTVATKLTDAVTGKVIRGRKVQLFSRHSKNGRWVKVTTKTTTRTGRAHVRKRLHRTMRYQWRFTGDKSHAAAKSKIQTVRVKAT
jgi:hypothetical protein